MKTLTAITLAVAAALLAPVTARAAPDTWKEATDGYFHDDAKWTDGSAPTAGDTVQFGVAGTYQVWWDSFTGNRTTQSMSLTGGDVTFGIDDSLGSPYTWTIHDGTSGADATIAGGTLTLGLAGYDGALILDVDDVLKVDSGGTMNVVLGNAVESETISVGLNGAGTLAIATGGSVSASEGYLGWNVGSDGTAAVDGSGSTWTITSNLQVGNLGTGTLAVTGGGQVSSGVGLVGAGPGSTGEVTVDGSGSTWTTTEDLEVGASGSGTLAVTGGGHVWSTWGYVGYGLGSTGEVTVDGSGSTWATTEDLYVGGEGAGTLAVTGGGQVATGGSGYVGFEAGSTGDVTVDGIGSTWTTTGLNVGAYGSGTLAVTGGGQVSSDLGSVGFYAGSTGEVTVDGIGSTWSLGGDGSLLVGFFGAGTLAVTGGGTVSTGNGSVGYWAGSTGEVTVDGIGSTWTLGGDGSLLVGLFGAGTLAVTGGGTVSTTGNGYVGGEAGSTGTVTVDGIGSTLTIAESLYVGGSSSGAGGTGTLTVQNEGLVNVGGTLKLWPAGTVTLDGGTITTQTFDRTAGTFNWNAGTLRFTGDLLVDTGQPFGWSVSVTSGRDLEVANTLTLGPGGAVILDGGTITTTSFQNTTGGMFIHDDGTLTVRGGTYAPGTGNLSVDGNTPTALPHLVLDGTTPSGPFYDLYVGHRAQGALTISGGGQVSSDGGSVGFSAGSTGAVTVDGSGSTWTTSGLYVGAYGSGTLAVTGGGQVSSDGGSVGFSAGSTGEVTVDGSGSTWATTALWVGGEGAGTLAVTGGGQVSCHWAYVGSEAGSTGEATVDGSGSTWATTGDLWVGDEGAGTLGVANGGRVSNTIGYLGYNSTGNGTATVDGTGSTWMNSGTFWVGYYGSGTLTVENGGTVSSLNSQLGREVGSNGTATVDGAGSLWAVTNHLHVGNHGTGTLHITGGGSATITNDLYVGNAGTGTLDIASGGRVSNAWSGYLGFGSTGDGTATVDGAGSTWTNTASLLVGVGGTGALNVRNGGVVSNATGFLGYQNTGHGAATVDGTGSLWSSSGSLYLGGSATAAGGTGTLTVQDDGLVSVGGTLKLWPAGTLVVDGGTVTAGGLAGSAGAVVALADPAGGTALTVGSAASAAFFGDLRDGPGGSGSLRKVGAGMQTLGGVNSYTGATDIAEGVLVLPKGLGTPGATVTVAPGAELRAANVVNRPLAGEGTVTAMGSLLIGDLASPTGWDFPGTLGVGSNSVLLLDADVAALGTLTTLAAGGRLNSFGGARLGPDGAADPAKVLAAAASAVVDGLFTNNGLVEGPTDPGQWLTFEDDVDGLGTFTGNIRFRGDYTVGMGAGALAATTCFEGSTLLVGEGCSLDLGGPTTFEHTVTKTGAGILTVDGPQDHGPDALLEILAGTVWLNTDAGGGGDFSISVTGAELYFGANQHLDTLSISDDGKVVFAGAQVVVLEHLVIGGMDLGATTLTPEPATLSLLALGGLGVLLRRRRK